MHHHHWKWVAATLTLCSRVAQKDNGRGESLEPTSHCPFHMEEEAAWPAELQWYLVRDLERLILEHRWQDLSAFASSTSFWILGTLYLPLSNPTQQLLKTRQGILWQKKRSNGLTVYELHCLATCHMTWQQLVWQNSGMICWRLRPDTGWETSPCEVGLLTNELRYTFNQ